MLDLVDYCHRRMSTLLGSHDHHVTEVQSDSSDDENGLPSKSKIVKVSLHVYSGF